MATIYQVSELAGVSLATVSRVINHTGKVSDKTKQKVLDAMSELGYRPNTMAQSLATNTTNSVGLLIPELKGPFFGDLMSGVEETLRAVNKHVIITASHSNEKQEKEGIEFLLSRRVDALILHVDAVSDQYLIELSEGSVPLVIVNRLVPEIADKCIHLDNKIGGYLAAKHVVEKGHTDIAYITGMDWKADSNDRLFGHKAALEEKGVPFDEELMYVGNFEHDSGAKGLVELIHKQKAFSVIICANDEMASGAMSMARKLGMDLPKDLSIVGYDNIIYSGYLYPTLTTINYPVYQMAQMAAKYILKEVYEQKGIDVNLQFTPKLVERKSVRQVN